MFGLAPASLLTFMATAMFLAIAPGPDNLGVLSLGLSRGRRAAAGFAFGCASGCLFHTVLAAVGVSALIAASPSAFLALKLAGAAYLLYLASKALRSNGGVSLQGEQGGDDAFLPYVRRGILANVINPKVALFFLAFLPQFVNGQYDAGAQIMVLGLLFTVSAMLVFQSIALFSGLIGNWLRQRQGVSLWLDRLTGLLFIGLAARLALAQR
ncbi:LysE family translocator [Chitinimonas sp.]|uniref:LysE family translocator n=1 Tax=Chitinimonas sp. TaxID=1934313 RepID=UPI0035B28706